VDLCEEKNRLSLEVTRAAQHSYAAKADFDRATDTKEDKILLSTALAIARQVERDAVRALDQHKKEHGC